MKKRKVMKLMDPETGKMVCKVCGSVHWAQLNPGGKFKRDSSQCINGCKTETANR